MDFFIQQMNDRIHDAEFGKAFMLSDFVDLMDYETAKKSIARLCERGLVRRVLRGVYDIPKYSSFLNDYVAPDPNEIAVAIARNNRWVIAPSGNTALNQLGLSTQVPARWEYISTGPTRTYKIGNASLVFVHRAERFLKGISAFSAMVFEALRTIGEQNLSEEMISHLKNRLSPDEKTLLLRECGSSTHWIKRIVKRIADEKE